MCGISLLVAAPTWQSALGIGAAVSIEIRNIGGLQYRTLHICCNGRVVFTSTPVLTQQQTQTEQAVNRYRFSSLGDQIFAAQM